MHFGKRPHAVACEDYLRPNSSEPEGHRRSPAEPQKTFALIRAGFLDERGVRWTPSIPLLTGRFGVRVPGGAPSGTGRSRPVLGVSGRRRVPCAHAVRAPCCLPSAYRRGERGVERTVAAALRVRARRGTGTITARGGRLQAQV
jgi:hypothetical protein